VFQDCFTLERCASFGLGYTGITVIIAVRVIFREKSPLSAMACAVLLEAKQKKPIIKAAFFVFDITIEYFMQCSSFLFLDTAT
jgi:hypothetical protein